jgi:hypothetical protein
MVRYARNMLFSFFFLDIIALIFIVTIINWVPQTKNTAGCVYLSGNWGTDRNTIY